MAMFASGEVVPAQQSQESHLLSPDISAAGSENGQLEDLKGESFSELVDGEHHSLAKEAAKAEAATPYHRQQTLLKTPASLANPGTCSTSATRTTGKSKTDTPQATQKQGKSNNAKMSAKAALSTSRRAAPINIEIVRVASLPSSRPSSSSSSSTAHRAKNPAPQYGPSHSFSMNMLPMTKIRELCLHAAGHARRHFDIVLDGSRFEARDRDGHVFQGHETLSEEILSGETIYLVEGGLDVRGAAKAVRGSKGANEKPKTSSRERGRLLCLKSLELEGEEEETKTPYRTPSVSSRASSSRSESKGRAGQPRMTASQKALAIAQMGRTPAPKEPVVGRKLPTSSAVRKSLPSPALEKVGESADEEVRDRGSHVGEPAETDDLDANLVAASLLCSSFPPPQQPPPPQRQQAIPPDLQDSQIVIPDSQDPFSQGLFSQQSVEPDHPEPTLPTPDTFDTQKAQSRPSPRVETTTAPPKLQMSRPDPYDINTVLSDDENVSDGSSNNNTTNIKMSSSVRKLGSSTTKRRPVAPPPVSLPSPHPHQSNEASPLRAQDATVPAVASKKATPTKKATPIKAEPSSPALPLPSSPTTNVAAAIAKGGQSIVGKGRRPSFPSPGQFVYHVPSDSDSDDDLIEEAFRDLSSSIPTPSLPWSAPPLRAAPDAETGVGGQPDPSRSTAGAVKYGTIMDDEVSFVGMSPKKSSQKIPQKSLLNSPLKKPLGQSPSPGKKSSQKSPTKTPIITSPSKIEEATIVKDSSSAEESDHEKDVRTVKKETSSSEEGIDSTIKLADVPHMNGSHQNVDKEQHEVIEISSGSDSDIEPSTDLLEDDEVELPSIDVELLAEREQLPSLPRSPAQANQSPTRKSPKIDPVKIEPAYKEPPPFAQSSKRKRSASEEDPEDEQHRRKRIKREAKKARWKHNREQKAAMLLQEERDKELAALQEERKKLALEKAHRRALELEIIVSSPIKRELSIELSEEGDDDDSGLGSSPHGDDADADLDRVGVPLDGDDKNDSLSSKESEVHHPSWRKVSKLHLSSSPPKGSQDHLAAPPTSTPAIIEAQLQQCVEERFHRMPFDDWAFLENTLGRGVTGGCGYSPLEVHTRVHLDMMHRAQHPPLHTSGKRESSNAHAIDESKSAALPDQTADDDDASARSRSQRSEAPSPKEHRAAEEEETARTREEPRKVSIRKKKKAKTAEKRQHERARRDRVKKANRRYHHDFRNACARNGGMKKQQR